MWIILVTVSAFFYSLSTFFDNHLVDKYLKRRPAETLIFFSAPGSLLVALGIWWWQGSANIMAVSWSSILLLLICGVVDTLGIMPYLRALKKEDATDVSILLQLSPLVALVLAMIFLQEVLTAPQLFAFGIMMGAALLITVNFKGRKIKWRGKTLWLILLASLFWNLSYILFARVSLETNYWVSFFWLQIGIIICVAFLWMIWKEQRRAFFAVLKRDTGKQITLNMLNEGWHLLGEIFYRHAFLLVPAALVSVSESVIQLLITFILGIALTLLVPSFCCEKLDRPLVVKRLAATLMMIGGLVLIG